MTIKSPSVTSPRGLSLLSITVAVGILSFLVYYQTAFRTITWWNSGEFTLAAASLGVMHPPGCLLGTILGWIVTKLAVCGSIAFSLNLFAGLIASVTAVIVGLTAGSSLRRENFPLALPIGGRTMLAVIAGAVIGALTLAFSETFWLYATKFTPYIFTVLFTALIVWAMIKLAGAGAGAKAPFWILVITLLFGLDFSVHRTNLLMAPGLIVWILIINPRMFLSWRTWAYGAAGLIAGLAFHMLIIPMAAAKPFLNANSPDTWSSFWDYVTLKQLGGGFLVKFYPRNAAFWDVQVMDYLRAFSANFFSWKGSIPEIGFLPGVFGLFGLIGIWRSNRRIALGMIVLFLLTSLGAIIYFNIPANYFRSLFRHYMPSFVIFSVWIAFGIGQILIWLIKTQTKRHWLVYYEVALLLILIPGYQIANNFDRLNGSKNYFAADYALNMLNNLPEDAILITFGDNDTFPLWHFQIVEGIRPDVTVLNNSLLNTSWFIRQSLKREPDLPLGVDISEIDSLRVKTWTDTTIVVIPVEGGPSDFGLTADVTIPDSMYLEIPPTVANQYILISDQLILNLIQHNKWRRPIYIAATGGIGWLQPYINSEGLVNRLTPIKNPPPNEELLTVNLLEKYSYRGFADENVIIDPTTKTIAINYYASFLRIADVAYQRGDKEYLEQIKDRMSALMPPDRLRPLPEWGERVLQYFEAMGVEAEDEG